MEINKDPLRQGKTRWVVVVTCAFIGMWIVGSCNEQIPRQDIEDAVQKAVSTDLTDPSGSHFAPDSDVKIEKKSDDTYSVSGYVDAANAFGGHVRNNYTAEVTKNDQGYDVQWYLTNALTGQVDNGDNQE